MRIRTAEILFEGANDKLRIYFLPRSKGEMAMWRRCHHLPTKRIYHLRRLSVYFCRPQDNISTKQRIISSHGCIFLRAKLYFAFEIKGAILFACTYVWLVEKVKNRMNRARNWLDLTMSTTCNDGYLSQKRTVPIYTVILRCWERSRSVSVRLSTRRSLPATRSWPRRCWIVCFTTPTR